MANFEHSIFSNLPFGAVVLLGLSIFLRVRGDTNDARKLPLRAKLASMDPVGCILFLSAVCCLLLALQWGGQTKAWDSSAIIGLFVGTCALLVLFVGVQWKRGDNALIPLRVFCKRNIFTSAMILFFLGGAIYLVAILKSFSMLRKSLDLIISQDSYFLPFYFEAVRGISPVSSGVNFIPLMLSQMVALIITGAIVKQWGYYVRIQTARYL